MGEPIEVRVRDCACPDTPHPEGDEVYLLPSLSLEGGAAAELDLMDSGSITDEKRRTTALLARWTATYVRYGAVGWNWLRLGESGRPEPVPFDVDVLLADYRLSRSVAEKANELYAEAVLGPLLRAAAEPPPNRQQRRSRTGRTAGSTSARPASTSTPPVSSSPDPSDGPALRIAR